MASMTPPLSLPDPLPVAPLRVARGGAPFDVTVRPPGSKSLTNRVVLLAALARGTSVIRGALIDADDSERMAAAATALGATVERDGGAVRVTGVGGKWRVPTGGVRLDLGNAGTATRFLAASVMLADGSVTIDGNERMRRRPIGELIDVLRAFGVRAEYLETAGCPPVRLVPPEGGVRAPARLDIAPTRSSQFVSALLLTAPWLRGGVTVRLLGEVTSASYVEMTLNLLSALGASVMTSEDMRVARVGPPESPDGDARPGLDAFEYDVEPDASGATYFWGAAALFAGASCRVVGLGTDSLQADARFPDLLSRMGCRVTDGSVGGVVSTTVTGVESLRPVMADLSRMPDAAMTLAVVAGFAGGTSVLRGLGTLRDKECDRIAALERELGKVGVRVEPGTGGDAGTLTITPPAGGIDCSEGVAPVEFETYDDHRMAMSLSLVGLRRPGVWIRNPGCVAKTYPGYWRDLESLRGRGG